jgi:hypothetical protein
VRTGIPPLARILSPYATPASPVPPSSKSAGLCGSPQQNVVDGWPNPYDTRFWRSRQPSPSANGPGGDGARFLAVLLTSVASRRQGEAVRPVRRKTTLDRGSAFVS